MKCGWLPCSTSGFCGFQCHVSCRAVFEDPNFPPPFFCEGHPLRTAPKDHQSPTATNRQTSFNSASAVLCRTHALTMKQRASP